MRGEAEFGKFLEDGGGGGFVGVKVEGCGADVDVVDGDTGDCGEAGGDGADAAFAGHSVEFEVHCGHEGSIGVSERANFSILSASFGVSVICGEMAGCIRCGCVR